MNTFELASKAHRVLYLLIVLALSSCASTSTVPGVAKPDCVGGTYMIDWEDGSCSVWGFSEDGEFLGMDLSSSEKDIISQHGQWQKTGDRELRVTIRGIAADDERDLNLVQGEAVVRFLDDTCSEAEGERSVRLFDAEEDPMDPSTDTGVPIQQTFVGRLEDAEPNSCITKCAIPNVAYMLCCFYHRDCNKCIEQLCVWDMCLCFCHGKPRGCIDPRCSTS